MKRVLLVVVILAIAVAAIIGAVILLNPALRQLGVVAITDRVVFLEQAGEYDEFVAVGFQGHPTMLITPASYNYCADNISLLSTKTYQFRATSLRYFDEVVYQLEGVE